MIRRHPEALAIGVILFFLPIGAFFRSLHEETRRAIAPIHRELRLQRDNFHLKFDRALRRLIEIRAACSGESLTNPKNEKIAETNQAHVLPPHRRTDLPSHTSGE